jgi:hypothetical protein
MLLKPPISAVLRFAPASSCLACTWRRPPPARLPGECHPRGSFSTYASTSRKTHLPLLTLRMPRWCIRRGPGRALVSGEYDLASRSSAQQSPSGEQVGLADKPSTSRRHLAKGECSAPPSVGNLLALMPQSSKFSGWPSCRSNESWSGQGALSSHVTGVAPGLHGARNGTTLANMCPSETSPWGNEPCAC